MPGVGRGAGGEKLFWLGYPVCQNVQKFCDDEGTKTWYYAVPIKMWIRGGARDTMILGKGHLLGRLLVESARDLGKGGVGMKGDEHEDRRNPD